MSETTSDKIPHDGVWRRWSINALPEIPDPALGKMQADAPLSRLDREALRTRIREQAQKEGFNAGFARGRAEGHKEGLKEGYQAGHLQGLETGRQDAQEELRTQLAQTIAPLAPLAQNFDAALKQLSEDMAGELVELALAVGCHLARSTLDLKPDLILGVVRDLLYMEPTLAGKPRLWLHPEDLLLVQQQLGSELEAADWTLQPDAQVSRGGCRVTGNSGAVDATWEQRLHSLAPIIRKPPSRRKRESVATKSAAT